MDQSAPLAEKIRWLFAHRPRPDGRPWSKRGAARRCEELSGLGFSHTYMQKLCDGESDNPTKRHLEALAECFRVPPAFFFDQGEVYAQLKVAVELGKAGVTSVELPGELVDQFTRNGRRLSVEDWHLVAGLVANIAQQRPPSAEDAADPG